MAPLTPGGAPVPCQSDATGRVAFVQTTPAMGTAWLSLSTGHTCARGVLDSQPYIASDLLRLDFDALGHLLSIRDLEAGTTLAASVGMHYYTSRAGDENAW